MITPQTPCCEQKKRRSRTSGKREEKPWFPPRLKPSAAPPSSFPPKLLEPAMMRTGPHASCKRLSAEPFPHCWESGRMEIGTLVNDLISVWGPNLSLFRLPFDFATHRYRSSWLLKRHLGSASIPEVWFQTLRLCAKTHGSTGSGHYQVRGTTHNHRIDETGSCMYRTGSMTILQTAVYSYHKRCFLAHSHLAHVLRPQLHNQSKANHRRRNITRPSHA